MRVRAAHCNTLHEQESCVEVGVLDRGTGLRRAHAHVKGCFEQDDI